MVEAMLVAPPEGGEVERSTIDSAATVWAFLTEALEGPLTVEERRKGERALSAFWERIEALGLTEDDLMAHLRLELAKTGLVERHLSPVHSSAEIANLGDGEGWATQVERSRPVPNTASGSASAQDLGPMMARDRKVEQLIHRRDKTIGGRKTYGRDPRRSKK